MKLNMNIESLWIGVGLAGQTFFFLRFLCQWLTSERKKESVIPASFWYFSMLGAFLVLAYAIYRRDLVFILGQSFGMLVYTRNLYFVNAKNAKRS